MSFNLGLDDLPSGYNSHGAGYGDEGGSLSVHPSDEAFSTAFSTGGSTGPTAGNDIRTMLESNKDNLKLEAMKRLVAMIAKGKHESVARGVFPSVVKCVVGKNPELRKLVYAYLVRFAESEPDLALLSVSSFQRALKDPNPLVRGSALRVLSSIRVPVIAPLVLTAIKESTHDMSPYVRKTAALSISKLVNLDPDLKEEAINLVELLLKDKTSHVLGSVVAAFNEICPERLDLLDKNYRKLVSLLPDFDEWGQVLLVNLLTRYARTQFIDPIVILSKPSEVGDNGEDDDDDGDKGLNLDVDCRMLIRNCRPLLQSRNSAVVFSVLQLHLALFMSNTEPLTMPNGSTLHPDVYKGILSTYMGPCVKPLVRLIASSSSHREIQTLVLSSIVSLTHLPPMATLFEPFLRTFFVKNRDSQLVKALKLQVLVNLSTSGNVPLILREFQSYINTIDASSEDESNGFVTDVICAIGDVSSRIKEIGPMCLKGLVQLLNSRNEAIVAQAVITIKSQIMNSERDSGLEGSTDSNGLPHDPAENTLVTTLIIKQLVNSKLMNSDPVNLGIRDKTGSHAWSKARATILWILAQFCGKNQMGYLVSSDILRKITQSFPTESDIVKLQVLNLATKMQVATSPKFILPFLTDGEDKNSLFDIERFNLLVTYIFNLAKYDLNYDIRDRARFLRSLLKQVDGLNFERVRYILFHPDSFELDSSLTNGHPSDPGTVVTNGLEESGDHSAIKVSKTTSSTKRSVRSNEFRVGTMSHFLESRCKGYEELPGFPDVAPDPSNRAPPRDPTPPPAPRPALHSFNAISDNLTSTSASSDRNSFYTDGSDDDEETDSSDEEEETSGSEEETEEESGEEEDESSEEEEDDDESSEEEVESKKETKEPTTSTSNVTVTNE